MYLLNKFNLYFYIEKRQLDKSVRLVSALLNKAYQTAMLLPFLLYVDQATVN